MIDVLWVGLGVGIGLLLSFGLFALVAFTTRGRVLPPPLFRIAEKIGLIPREAASRKP